MFQFDLINKHFVNEVICYKCETQKLESCHFSKIIDLLYFPALCLLYTVTSTRDGHTIYHIVKIGTICEQKEQLTSAF